MTSPLTRRARARRTSSRQPAGSSRRSTLVVSALAAALLAGCSAAGGSPIGKNSPSSVASGTSSSSAPATTKGVTLRVGDQEQLTETLLRASGQLRNVPYHLQWDEFTSGPPLLSALSSGNLDLGSVGDAPPVFAAASDEAIRVVAATYSGGDRNDAIVVPPGSRIHSVSQLRGKKVAVAEGTSGNEALLAALSHAGLSWKDITPVYLQPPAALAALKTGSIDAWAVWYPFVALAEQQGAKVIESATSLDPGYGFLVSSPAALASRQKTAAIANFITRLRAAQAWADSHQRTWATAYSKLTGLPLSAAEATAGEERGERYVAVTAGVAAAEQHLADNFAGIGLIAKTNVSSLFDHQFSAELGG